MKPEFVRVKLENGAEASVPKGVAESAGLKPLDKPAVDDLGRVLPEKPPANLPPIEVDGAPLKGKALNDALTAVDLSTSGTVAEKQARLAEYHASQPAGVPTNPDGTPAVGDNTGDAGDQGGLS